MADHAHTETLALRVQFDTEAQQKDASTLGMWIFLITEIMFFGGMFAVYTVYRNWYPHVFAIASSSLNEIIGAANTGVLLLSSFTMVMAVRAGQLGQQKTIVMFPDSHAALRRRLPRREGLRVERKVRGAPHSRARRPSIWKASRPPIRDTPSCSSRSISR